MHLVPNSNLTPDITSRKQPAAKSTNAVEVRNSKSTNRWHQYSSTRNPEIKLSSTQRECQADDADKSAARPPRGREASAPEHHLFLRTRGSGLPAVGGSGRRGRDPAATAPAHGRGHGRRGRGSEAPRRGARAVGGGGGESRGWSRQQR